jgi:signal transduction histidine kinase
MTGFSKEELLKMDIRELIMEEDFNTFNFNKGEDFVNETKIRRKNGEFIFVEQSIAPIVIGGKKYYQIIARDITEKKKLEKEKEKLVRQLYQADKLASIGLLAAGVAHSINNPLTSISLNAEILKRKIKDRDIKKKIETIEEQVNIVASITKSLLDFSMEIRSEDKMVDLNEIIKKDLETLSFSLKEIYVYKDLGKIPKIKGNASKLHQLFMNLFMNSIHAMPTGGNLKVSTVKEGVNVIVTVSDTGQGIPKEYLSKIFDPFFTTKEVGEGTGLGLSICHGIVKEHGGVIDVESELGKGTTFKIRFPVRS